MRVSAIENYEGTLAGGGMNVVIVGKLGHRKPVTPVGLLVVDEHPEISLELLVDSFSLSISLWVEGCGCVWGDVQ